ncbi:hypothetical protein P171DRAFT_169262 [Karstenula rhodostoma CBS 690.94]|uniref:Uncharacterized protein n=1 Tax=Karstenula rhodostoma CBS 690.94 TaxID=1392251 RepID=A0A9P4P7N0_9PLEO|nr:hypothetical protein P171DRAFT_169262 [Karstenula rhodostoma CBS 690.94]
MLWVLCKSKARFNFSCTLHVSSMSPASRPACYLLPQLWFRGHPHESTFISQPTAYPPSIPTTCAAMCSTVRINRLVPSSHVEVSAHALPAKHAAWRRLHTNHQPIRRANAPLLMHCDSPASTPCPGYAPALTNPHRILHQARNIVNPALAI